MNTAIHKELTSFEDGKKGKIEEVVRRMKAKDDDLFLSPFLNPN